MIPQMEDKQKTRKERAKAAVALAMNGRGQQAAAINSLILADFPDDQEAINRLGKSLSELGRNRAAKEAFERALALSPHNTIARKNLERLNRLGDDQPSGERQASSLSHTLIAESGKAGVTSLLGLAPAKVLFTLAPGHVLSLRIEGNNLKAYSAQGQLIGQVEPKLASRTIASDIFDSPLERSMNTMGCSTIVYPFRWQAAAISTWKPKPLHLKWEKSIPLRA